MSNALEYIFYRQEFCDQFTSFLSARNLPWTLGREPIQDAFVVFLNEEDIAPVWDEVDEHYDELAANEAETMELDNVEDNISTAGIHIQLAGGRNTIAKVDPGVLKRILSAVSHDEFAAFIDTVVSSVEQPDDSPICHTPDESH
jgi:hypothetical protein